MKRSRHWVRVVSVLGLLATFGVWNDAEASECKGIRAELNGPIFACAVSPVGFCSEGAPASGLLKGSKEAVYQGLTATAGMPDVEPPTTYSYSGLSVFHTDEGDLYTSFVGVLDAARRVFTEVSRVTAGAGRFANAAGNLFISGTLSMNLDAFESRITGEVCLQH